jgi:hypothetical protein
MKKDQKNPDSKEKTEYVKVTYPYNRPGPGNYKDKKVDLTKTKEFNYAYPSVTDLMNINWKLVQCCAVSNEGATGVIFVHGNDGNFVLKGSADPAVEYFGNLLFQELKIASPAMCVIPHDDP